MAGAHWQLEQTEDKATLTLDVQGQSANVLSHTVLSQLDKLLDDLESQTLSGLIIRSGKSSGFIFGADITEFQTIQDADQATELARTGQRIFDRIACLTYPVVAVIHGNCLGGGLELALACSHRVARDDTGTRMGLPEVRLGINPGFGGTVRLPKLIGDLAALNLMLSGHTVSSKAAKRLGLVDVVVPERHLIHAAEDIIKSRPKRKLAWKKSITAWQPLRPMVRKYIQKQVDKKANPDHYPAPSRILDLWQMNAGLAQEAVSLGELLVGRTSRNLVHVFMLGEQLKRKGKKHAHDIKYVHVIGAGVMGGDIAAWSAFKGFHVSLHDQNKEALAKAIKRAYSFFSKKLKSPREVQAAMDRLMPDLRGDGLNRADLVIEAIVENEEIKKKVFAEVESRVKKQTLLATNTSSIPLENISAALKDKSRLVGLHFFNPVAKMQLVEIVRGESSSQTNIDRAHAFTTAISRLPLEVKSSPGFLVNRILMPYLVEAMNIAEEGVSIAEIDKAALDFGMPMGPIDLADVVGLDICLSVAEELSESLNMTVPERLRQMVDSGKLGRKSGEGFYQYDSRGRAKKVASSNPSHVPITERLILRLLNEAMACLREGVVTDRDAVDAGIVYGTGFAPYMGGPMAYALSMGETGISHSLYRLVEVYGKRFTPDSGWSQPELLGQ